MSTFSCYRCEAAIVHGMRECASCGAEQTKSALAAFQQVQQAKGAIERMRVFFSTLTLVAFCLGGGAGFWAGVRHAQEAPTAASLEAELSQEEVIDLFLRRMNAYTKAQGAPMNLVAWVPGADGEILFEMAPPSKEHPVILWEALTDQERSALVGYFALAYTQALVAGGQPVTMADGHPVVTLKYYGSRTPLATRGADGKIYLFRSPYAAGSQSSAPAASPSQAPPRQ